MSSDIGIFGMGTMGQALALNFAMNNFKVACYNRKDMFFERMLKTIDTQKIEMELADDDMLVFDCLSEFVKALQRPRYASLGKEKVFVSFLLVRFDD